MMISRSTLAAMTFAAVMVLGAPAAYAQCTTNADCDDGDGLDCTFETCVVDDCVASETCTENCRGPGFWQNHAGDEKDGNNITQAVLSSVGGLEICGRWITQTDPSAGMSSAEQALCIRTQGVEQRQLDRQLLAAGLNCAISEGADCESITSRFIDVSFNDCNAICAGTEITDGPTVDECIDALACFNKGGRFENGVCSTGTCDDDGTTLCEADEDCDSDDCVPYADTCADGTLCLDDLPDADSDICFETKGPASSPKQCRDTRKDGCNVDDQNCSMHCRNIDTCTAACEQTEGCDPVTDCVDFPECWDACVGDGFPGVYDCGCEWSWSTMCSYYYGGNENDYYLCLYYYPLLEPAGWCEACQNNPLDISCTLN
jgi:hypothetical protein